MSFGLTDSKTYPIRNTYLYFCAFLRIVGGMKPALKRDRFEPSIEFVLAALVVAVVIALLR